MKLAEKLAKKYNAMIDCGPDYGMQPDCRAVAAINAALEEAAKVAEDMYSQHSARSGGRMAAKHIAAAIRNLQEGE